MLTISGVGDADVNCGATNINMDNSASPAAAASTAVAAVAAVVLVLLLLPVLILKLLVVFRYCCCSCCCFAAAAAYVLREAVRAAAEPFTVKILTLTSCQNRRNNEK